jgi:Family of unknown function (DUF5335)
MAWLLRSVSRALLGKRAKIGVASLVLGDQIEAEWVPVLGITYDQKDDVLEYRSNPVAFRPR